MLKLRDFFNYPEVNRLVEQLIMDRAGLIVIAGPDPRVISPAGSSQIGNSGVIGNSDRKILPNGRTTIFRILMEELQTADETSSQVIITADKLFIRVPRRLQRRISVLLVEPPLTYAIQMAQAMRLRPRVMIVDRLDRETLPLALEAVTYGIKVVTQLETVFQGASLARQLLDLGARPEQLGYLTWVLAVQRLATLCPSCRQPVMPSPAQQEKLKYLYRRWGHGAEKLARGADQSLVRDDWVERSEDFYRAVGCTECQGTGLAGDAGIIDIFHSSEPPPGLFAQASMLPAGACVMDLALRGQLALEDLLQFEEEPHHQTSNILAAREQTLAETTATVERLRAELEAANRVLQQRTHALFSLEEFSQVLIGSTQLNELAYKVCRRTRDLCGADKAILYFQHTPEQVAILAVVGWEAERVKPYLDTWQVLDPRRATQPTSYPQLPPGILPSVEGRSETLRAGLYVPLVSQERLVGLMIVHATQKGAFTPGEVALLQTFANQVAMALQRAGLVEQLQSKITELEAAQIELARKERLERELELARQVQPSILPRRFPQVAGYQFMARNEPAYQVGGDFYDAFTLDEDHFGVVVADVSDKGMPAALYMALTRSLLLAEARRERSPRTVLVRVNDLLLELGDQAQTMFVTVFYGVVECSTRRITYARGGHDRPLILRMGDNAAEVHELGGKGAALGVLSSMDFQLSEEFFSMEHGDRLVLFTDGLTDVMTPNGQPLGLGQLKSLLQCYAELAPAELCDLLFAALTMYREAAEQFDDMTLLVVGVE